MTVSGTSTTSARREPLTTRKTVRLVGSGETWLVVDAVEVVDGAVELDEPHPVAASESIPSSRSRLGTGEVSQGYPTAKRAPILQE